MKNRNREKKAKENIRAIKFKNNKVKWKRKPNHRIILGEQREIFSHQ